MLISESPAQSTNLIEEVLNLALNRHIHVLTEKGYLKPSYAEDYGYEHGRKQPALLLKWKVIDAVCQQKKAHIDDFFQHPNEQHQATKMIVALLECAFDEHIRHLEKSGYLKAAYHRDYGCEHKSCSATLCYRLPLMTELIGRIQPFIAQILTA